MEQKMKLVDKINRFIRRFDNISMLIIGLLLVMVWTTIFIPSTDRILWRDIVFNIAFIVALINFVWRFGFYEVFFK